MVQDAFQVGDIKYNADKIIEDSISASRNGADLVVFPELALVGYPPEDLLFRSGFLKQVRDACLRIQDTLTDSIGNTGVVFGLPIEMEDHEQTGQHRDRLYNAAVFLQHGIIKHSYFKRSLPNYSVFDELRYFVAGNESVIIDVRGYKLGLLICEDVWRKDIVADCVTSGAQGLIVMNASPYHTGKHEERAEMLRANASQFGIPLFYLNMTGGQDELVFDGDSLVCDRDAELSYRANLFERDLIEISFDGKDVSTTGTRTQDESIANLSVEAMTYKALVTGTRDFVHQNGFSGVVIGLSGGVDSALTLVLAVDALGAENVSAIMMPSRYTADISLQDAEAEARLLGVQYDVLTIEDIFNNFMSALRPVFKDAPEDTTEENLQARCRGVLLMACLLYTSDAADDDTIV
mgnify:FL=1